MATVKLKTGANLDNISLPGKLAVGLVFVAMVAAAYFVVFYGETQNSIEAQQANVATQRTRLAEAEEARKKYNEDLAKKARHEALARKQKKMLPDDAEMPTFLSTLQTVATISGVTLTKWTPQGEEREQFYAKVPMGLRLEGKFHQVAKFFYGIGQVDRIINMENIRVSVLDAGKNKDVADNAGKLVRVECLATAFRSVSGNQAAAAKGRPGAKNAGGKKK